MLGMRNTRKETPISIKIFKINDLPWFEEVFLTFMKHGWVQWAPAQSLF